MKGEIVDVTEGGLTAQYDEDSGNVFVAPALNDEITTVVAPLRTVACFRLDDARFGFDHSFLEPASASEFAILKDILDNHPNCPLAVFGHADLTGRDDYNKRLSGRRAESVYAMLTRRVDMWESLVNEHLGNDVWGELQWQKILVRLGYLVPPAQGKQSEASRNATKAFQADYDLKVDGIIGPKTRFVLMSEYMDALCVDGNGNPYSVDPSQFLGQGKDPRGKGDYQGCGEFNPVVIMSKAKHQALTGESKKAQRDSAEAPNRRILVYVFKEGTTINPALWPCPRSKEGPGGCEKRFWSDAKARRAYQDEDRTFLRNRNTFACRFYHGLAMKSPCETTGVKRVRLNVLNPMGLPHKLRPFVIVASNAVRQGITDDQGRAEVLMPDGDHLLELPGHQFAHRATDEQKYEFAKHDQYSELEIDPIDPTLAPPRAGADDPLEGALEELEGLAAYAHSSDDSLS